MIYLDLLHIPQQYYLVRLCNFQLIIKIIRKWNMKRYKKKVYLLIIATTLLLFSCKKTDNNRENIIESNPPLVGDNVVYLGDMRPIIKKFVGKRLTEILPDSEIEKIIILRSFSSAPFIVHETHIRELWKGNNRIKKSPLPLDEEDYYPWFDAVVILESNEFVRITHWRDFSRCITSENTVFF